jgi:hypothetical protein
MNLCHSCITGPKTVEGHPGLRLHSFERTAAKKLFTVFDCDACNATWRRACTASGDFTWKRIERPACA